LEHSVVYNFTAAEPKRIKLTLKSLADISNSTNDFLLAFLLSLVSVMMCGVSAAVCGV